MPTTGPTYPLICKELIQNEDEVIKIRLSKMIKKNSGGEGQNPLYVALLASFCTGVPHQYAGEHPEESDDPSGGA